MTASEARGIGASADPRELGFDPARLERIGGALDPYVDDGRLAGWQVVVTRRGEVAYAATGGLRDAEAGLPVTEDTVWRIYSMTKPITSVAAMMLLERGALSLLDPVARFIPSFAGVRVYAAGGAGGVATVPAVEPVRVWHLLTHTAGLTYGFHHAHAVDELYRAAGFDAAEPPGLDLAACCDAWAALPLVFQPGTEWNYSVATDVLGRVVEVASGRSLDAFLDAEVLGPLGMTETGFVARPDQRERVAALYRHDPASGRAVREDGLGARGLEPPSMLSGGGGLISTARDYHRFTQMLLREGELDGVRLLAPRTVRTMRANHLPGGADLETFGRPLFAETQYAGVGFGLGFSTVIDPIAHKIPCSAGEIAWGGMASTAFWVDPAEELTALLLTQLVPSSVHPLRPLLRTLVYAALVD